MDVNGHVYTKALHRTLRTGNEQCAICGWNKTRAMLDHCHQHGLTRGWLCGRCNQFIRSFEGGSTAVPFVWNEIWKRDDTLRYEHFRAHINRCGECAKEDISVAPQTNGIRWGFQSCCIKFPGRIAGTAYQYAYDLATTIWPVIPAATPPIIHRKLNG